MSYICDGTEAKKISELIKKFKEGMFCDFRIQFDRSPFTIKFWLRISNEDAARFVLTQQTGCCGILVSTDTFVETKHRGNGIAQEMMFLKEQLAKDFGYSLMLATVNMTGNPAECHILEKNGWQLGSSFINSRTKNKVGVYTKVLN
jgi:GNAT superfamily N-acetyltransferase